MNKLSERKFIHQNIPYSFYLNRDHQFFSPRTHPQVLRFGSSSNPYRKLRSHFLEVLKGNVPNQYFNSRDYPRISQFKIRGVESYYLKFFSKKLIRAGTIEKYDKDSNLVRLARKVHDNFNSVFHKKPGHNPVLKNILIKDENSVAIEVPIWKEAQNTCLTGHIDLIQLQDKTLKVVDYKPEGNFLVSLPQVAMYGLLIKERFGFTDLKCISFNKEEAWEYDPMILIEDIMTFLESVNVKERDWERFI